jgi:hypothetical protein
MTTQTAVIAAPTGLTLTAKLFTLADPDTTAFTADSVTERTNAKGQYVASFDEVSAISGDYTLILFSGTRSVVIGYRTFAGVDAEVATETPTTVELDPAVSAQITAIETFATRVTTGIVQDGAAWQFTANMLELGPSGGGGGDATLAKQEEILTAIQGSEVIQVASPNVSGNLVLTQGDDYDGVANPKASWTVSTDYTSGWTVRLTIRDADDAVVYANTGSVVSATVIAVTIAAPTGLTMTGCPGQWQGKFDVELTHSSGAKKTIALGTCYINEDQTR